MIKCSVPSAATVAPFGGTKALLTPDPMALAFPTNGEPVIIDISASITTNNMIADKIVKNEMFDFNCLLTKDGIPQMIRKKFSKTMEQLCLWVVLSMVIKDLDLH